MRGFAMPFLAMGAMEVAGAMAGAAGAAWAKAPLAGRESDRAASSVSLVIMAYPRMRRPGAGRESPGGVAGQPKRISPDPLIIWSREPRGPSRRPYVGNAIFAIVDGGFWSESARASNSRGTSE